jgi:hypothetical protein
LFSYSTLKILLRFFFFTFLFKRISSLLHNLFSTHKTPDERDAQVPKTLGQRSVLRVCIVEEKTLISWRMNEKKKMKNKLAELGRENLNDGARVAEKNMIPKEFPSYFRSRFSFPPKSTFKIYQASKNSSTLKIYARNVCFFWFHLRVSSLEAS